VLSGAHVALGRHVSTWAHAFFRWESHLIGGFPHHSHHSHDSHDSEEASDGRHSRIHPYSPLMHVPL
jgi:hypothetical protein